MFDHTHYVPILKGRDGEYGALQTLRSNVRRALTPLVEIPPIPWDYEEDKPARTIDKHLKKVGQKLEAAWGTEYDLFVDLLWISETERMNDGEHPLRFVFRSLRDRGLSAIPVVGLLRGADYLEVCRKIANRDKRGVCIRVQREDFVDFDDLVATLDQTLDSLAVKTQNADLILDLRALTPSERSMDAGAVIRLIKKLPALTQWRTFTLTATSFPPNLTGLPPSDSSLISGEEWDLWSAICTQRRTLPRIPAFGDYGISHPEPSEVDPRVTRPSASVRYTCGGCWLVMKALNLRDHGFQQFHEVSRELVARDEYSGRSFSWGDTYIDDCAAERVGTGNLTTWRKVGTSHHLAFAVRQLATHFGS